MTSVIPPSFEPSQTQQQRFELLCAFRQAVTDDVVSRSPFLQAVAEGVSDRRLYALGLSQTYYMVAATSNCLALIAGRMTDPKDRNLVYMRFCLHQALEEIGHEDLALADLRALGLTDLQASDLPPPLPETELFLAYMVRIAQEGDPLQRLGQMFWVERWHEPTNLQESRFETDMGLTPDQMTFIKSHIELDAQHSHEVESMVLELVETPRQWSLVARAMEIGLRSQRAAFDGCYREFLRLRDGAPSPYSFINAVQRRS